ncbi:Josephin-2 [Coemansia spiralis]|uniref:ubiquitinyl hydrolase 1 n=2 Tax=Coemansia TaxID=4863 RepID=A0A9W8KWP0_9FUNG|nr:Josephin-domain-containing protein [Coemansia spiralis]KAJ1995326.1 Josephin-2 [Coemansia umbellata]KAJ2624847.1 Josephin-2 [Coemansia sp. RSA 1358]KAJ2674353.1 Josephin-2 [Coemansia spiralis]
MKLRESPIYHEKQSFWLCAKHSLNNVLQQEVCTQADLERIAKYLHSLHPEQTGWLKFNAHKNFLGFGDYDVNVLTAALNEHECDLLWHDNRTNIDAADLSNCIGLIVHIQPEWFFRRGHWFAIKYFDQVVTAPVVPKTYVGQPRASRSVEERESREYEAKTYEPGFWNLDSKVPHPEYIGDRIDLNKFLQDLTKKNRMHVLLVVPLKPPSVSTSST